MRKRSLIVLTALLLTACESKQNKAQQGSPAIPVLAVNPTIKDVPVYIDSIGTLYPSIFVEIRPEINGTLSQVIVSEGQWVQKETPLFKINPNVYTTKVHEAEAQLAMDRTTLSSVQRKLERFKPLAEKDLVSKSEWEDLEALSERSQAQIELDESRLKASRIELECCTLTSPIDGWAGKIDAHSGQLVSRGQSVPLITLSKMDPLIVEFMVTEKEFSKLQNRLDIEISSLLSTEMQRKGTMTFFDNHFDQKTGLLLVRGLIENPDNSLRPGQNIRVRVPVDSISQAKLIPQKSVKYNQQGPYIYIVQPDQTVGFRQVLLGEDQGDNVIILEGIDNAEFVITDGHLRLSPGIKVEMKQ